MEPSLGVQHGHIRRSPPHDADARADGSDVALVSKALIHCSTVYSFCDQAFAPALVACYRRGNVRISSRATVSATSSDYAFNTHRP
jgi:hypothetical protein